MLRVLSLLLEPFTPNLSAKMNYLLGCSNESHPSIYKDLNNINAFMLQSLSQSKGIKDPIPLIR